MDLVWTVPNYSGIENKDKYEKQYDLRFDYNRWMHLVYCVIKKEMLLSEKFPPVLIGLLKSIIRSINVVRAYMLLRVCFLEI